MLVMKGMTMLQPGWLIPLYADICSMLMAADDTFELQLELFKH
ncbi:MAG: hypothetical protein ACLS5K_02235 [Streptococcus salivarius]